MTLAQYWSLIVKQWRLIIICLVVGGLGAYIGSKLMTPLYQSAALVQITVPVGNSQVEYYSGLLASDRLVQTEATLATSNSVIHEVASHYPGLTPDKLAQEATAAPKVNTQLFEIDVQDSNPTRAAALANDIATTLIKQQGQLAQQSNAQAGSFLVIAQPAQPALQPIRPKTQLNTAAGLVAGLLLGMLLAVLFEQLDTHARTSKTLSQLLSWRVLATVWKVHSTEEVINPKGSDANVESYRILRTNIGFLGRNKPVHSLVVTSASPLAGKTTVATNLAIFMARAGKKTLLIDADLRHSAVHKIFNLSPEKKGLSNAIQAFSTPTVADGSTDRKPVILDTPIPLSSVSKDINIYLEPFVHTVDISNLLVMPSGPLPSNPSELLDSKAMQRLLTELTSYEAEIVIFDTPPLLGLSDASILASKVDGTLLVVDVTRVQTESLRQVKALLAQAGARVLGCVVNKQQRSHSDALYYYNLDEQDGMNNHKPKFADNSALLPATPDVLRESDTQFH